jgi:hypothetical protein
VKQCQQRIGGEPVIEPFELLRSLQTPFGSRSWRLSIGKTLS